MGSCYRSYPYRVGVKLGFVRAGLLAGKGIFIMSVVPKRHGLCLEPERLRVAVEQKTTKHRLDPIHLRSEAFICG